MRLLGIPVEGKSIFPITGEFDPRVVRESAVRAGLLPRIGARAACPRSTPARCRRARRCSVPAARTAARSTCSTSSRCPVNGDIGCYTLGLIPPLSAIHSCGCMGASIGVAHGAAKAGSPERHVAVMGDSTFFHTGIPALINTVYNQSPVVTIIMDNRVTGMTGHQDNPSTGRTLQGQQTTEIEIEPLVRALGIKHVKTVPAFEVDEIEKTLKEYLKLDEPAVLITREPCALLPEGAQALAAAGGDRRQVQRLHPLLPRRLPGHPQERRVRRAHAAPQGPDRRRRCAPAARSARRSARGRDRRHASLERRTSDMP